jgi:hypothetical protein
MPARIPVEQIVAYVASSGCRLETNPTGIRSATQPLSLICSCGKPFKRSFSHFKLQPPQCKECGRSSSIRTRSNPIVKVRQWVEETQEIKLLSETYQNSHEPLQLQCRCGQSYEQTLSDLRSIRRNKRPHNCPKCSRLTNAQRHNYTLETVQDLIGATGCRLLSDSYDKATDKLSIQCRKCQLPYTSSWKDFQNNGTYVCNRCTSSPQTSIAEEQVRDFVLSLGFQVQESDRNPARETLGHPNSKRKNCN